MTPPLALEDAWDRLFALVRPLPGAQILPVAEAAGRYLAAPLAARRTQPADAMSAMDGFATAGAGPWRIVGEARAGAPFAGPLAPGEAVRVSTGAACPAGTEGIVIVEDAAIEGDRLSAPLPTPGRWVRPRGFDFATGDALLDRGTRLGPAQIALALAAGHGEVAVAPRPVVTVIECGDELVGDAGACPDHLLPASNGAMVAAMAAHAGAVVERGRPLPDEREALVRAFDAARHVDLVITTAGASVGEHDHVRGALADIGAELAFWRVAIRPGKPLLVARRGPQLVLGLPGNPVSSFVTAFLFVLPVIRALQGAADVLPRSLPLPLGTPLPPGEERREFLRAQWDGAAVQPLRERDSSALRTLAAADLLIDRPAGAPAAAAGAVMPCFPIGPGMA